MRFYYMLVWVVGFLVYGALAAGGTFVVVSIIFSWYSATHLVTVDGPYTCDNLNYYSNNCSGNVQYVGDPASGPHLVHPWPSYWQPLTIVCALLVGIFVGVGMGFKLQFDEQRKHGWGHHERNIHISVGEDRIDINEHDEDRFWRLP